MPNLLEAAAVEFWADTSRRTVVPIQVEELPRVELRLMSWSTEFATDPPDTIWVRVREIE